MRTDSAWPVSPVPTFWYSAVTGEPPEYPGVTSLTPFTCSKTASTPQQQPPASTAVCSPLELARGASRAGSGIAVAEAVTALQATIVATMRKMAALKARYLYMVDVPLNEYT